MHLVGWLIYLNHCEGWHSVCETSCILTLKLGYGGIKDSLLDITAADNKQLLVASGAKCFCGDVGDMLQCNPCGFSETVRCKKQAIIVVGRGSFTDGCGIVDFYYGFHYSNKEQLSLY